MRKKMSAPIIKIFPPEKTDVESDATLASVRAALSNHDNKMRLMGLLRSYGAEALVITPEYVPSRREDTGKGLVFHILLDNAEIDLYPLVKLTSGIGDIIGAEGFPSPCDRMDPPDLTKYFAVDRDENPFHEILYQLGFCQQQVQYHGPK